MSQITQQDCEKIGDKLHRRPRKTLGYITSEQCYTL